MPYCLSIRRAYSRARLSSRSTDSWAKENGVAALEGSVESDAFNRKFTHRLLFILRMVKQKLFEISIMPKTRTKIRRIDERDVEQHEIPFEQKPRLLFLCTPLFICDGYYYDVSYSLPSAVCLTPTVS